NATTETVTVTAEASLLKTESGDVSHNVSIDQLDDLPLLGIGTANSGSTGVRNPYNTLQTLPGVSNYASSGQFTLNGLGGAMTETMRVEGQDSTSRLFGTYDYTQMGQPSADSIQEISYQTSNYAAEYGQAGSAVINMTMKSGTNAFHGTGYDYFVNEDLNAGDPFTISGGPGSTKGGSGGKMRPTNRRNDFGGTLGGPVIIPKIYNGRNKTFFFWNYEEFLESSFYSFTDTVPAAAYLKGDFSAISPNGTCSLCSSLGVPTASITTDPAGRPVYANEIFDPTTRLANGTATPFANNQIPISRFDPVSLKVLGLLPAAQNNNLTGNYTASIGGSRYSAIPSIKVDHNISDRDKLSFYWSRINTESQISSPLGNADGLPENIGGYRGTFIPTYTTRVNYDRTLSPTLLLHLGAGYYHTRFDDHAPDLNFDPASLGLSNFLIHRQFPSITGLCNTPVAIPGGPPVSPCSGNTLGGMQNIGTSGQIQTLNFEEKPSFIANATWIHGAHTFKIGAEVYLEGALNGSFAGVTLATGTNATSAPFNPTNSLNGQSMGFGMASFLLGDYGTTALGSSTGPTQTPQLNYKQGNQEWGLYLQDTWKVTRKLTVNYGLRWDYATPYKETDGRLGQFSPTTPNANAGGILGATVYASTCNCKFYQNTYPYAIGPRLGVAYQLDQKTVLRGGWGVNYQFASASAGGVIASNGVYPLAGINPFVNIETPGSIIPTVWPVTDPNRYPAINPASGVISVGGTPANYAPDANQLRPPRVNQWSIGLERELTGSLYVDASYVANRGVWEPNGPLGYLSQISPATFASYGLYPYPGTGPAGYNYAPAGITCTPGNDCDRALLTQPLSNAAVQAKLAASGHPNFSPYAGFTGTSLLSALYPYPQFGALAPTGSATGDSRYDSLQIKLTKRLSHGLQANGAYTWAKGLSRPTPEDFFNPGGSAWVLQQIPPQALTFNITYTMPKFALLPKYANMATKDWQFGFFAQYQSGAFLLPPVSNVTANFLGSEDVRTGQPLYLKDINDIHSYNPYTDVVLNPAAWAPCPANSVCGGASTSATGTATSTRYYSDFRGPRQPRENANIGRHFRLGKEGKYDLYIRGEFVNIFNRTIMPNPIVTNPQTAPSKNGAGVLTGGFGVINAYNAPNAYPAPTAGATALLGRTGTIIARFQF
ncbi:MAG TPA: TonB-dependent receptor, partial [Bryobacteraceae bacterium]|nr:TonB-dependent receptor [Bryobacteraceae bacterium]